MKDQSIKVSIKTKIGKGIKTGISIEVKTIKVPVGIKINILVQKIKIVIALTNLQVGIKTRKRVIKIGIGIRINTGMTKNILHLHQGIKNEKIRIKSIRVPMIRTTSHPVVIKNIGTRIKKEKKTGIGVSIARQRIRRDPDIAAQRTSTETKTKIDILVLKKRKKKRKRRK